MNDSKTAMWFSSSPQGSYAKDAKIIGRVSATDADRDAESSAIGQILYSFANQSGAGCVDAHARRMTSHEGQRWT